MIKHELEGIEDVYNPLKSKLPQIVEYFVKFYGEKYREQIQNRIDNAIFIFADREIKNSLNEYFAMLKYDVALKFETDIEEVLGYEVVNDVIADGDFLLQLMPKIKEWKDDVKSADREELYSLLNIIIIDGVSIKDRDDFENVLQDKVAAGKIEEMLDDVYRMYESEFKDDLEYLDSEQKRIVNNGVEEELKSIDEKYLEDCQEFVSVSLIKSLNIEMTPENIKLLNEMTPDFMNYLLKDERFYTDYDHYIFNGHLEKLFEMSGLEKPDLTGLSHLQRNVEIDKLTNDAVMSLKEKLEELYDKRNEEISYVSSGYARARKIIDEDFVDAKKHNKEINDFINKTVQGGKRFAGCASMTASRSNPHQVKNIICNESILNFFDDVLVHEINHCVTSAARYDGLLFIKTGIVYDNEMQSTKGEFFSYDGTMDRYRLLNEVINEYITSKIYDFMKRDKFQIGVQGDSDGLSSYRVAFPILKRFFDENMQELIECSMSDDSELPYEIFGKENLDLLSNAVTRVMLLDSQKKTSYKYFMQEVEYMAGRNVDIFDLARDEEREWSGFTEEYLDCFAKVDKAVDAIREKKSIRDSGKFFASESEC